MIVNEVAPAVQAEFDALSVQDYIIISRRWVMRSVLLFTAVLFVSFPCLAATIHVPGDQPTIQTGVNAAQPDDTVLVACGVYNEHDIMLRSGITLLSQTGDPSCVTIDAQDLGQVLIALSLNPTVTVKGFVLENGHGGEGGGIRSNNSSLLIENCDFISNGGRVGGGLKAESGSVIHVRECRFLHNNGNNAGGGILGEYGSEILVEDSYFEWNTGTGGAGICVWFDVSLTVLRSRFVNNICPSSVFSFGGAIVTVDGHDHPTIIEDCVFSGNHASKGGAIAIGTCYAAHICRSSFYDNTSAYASGVWLEYTDALIDNCIIAFGDGPSNGGFGSSPQLICCDVFGNMGGDWIFLFNGQDGVNGNFAEDPLFCLESNPDDPLTLNCLSPCASENNPECGLIGALGVGCGITTIQNTSWSALKSLY